VQTSRSHSPRDGSERGQAIVEFALTIPILLILLLGIVEFGHGLNSYLTVLASSRDAARLGAQGGATEATMLLLVGKETERLPTTLPSSSENCASGAGVCITQPSVGGSNAVKVKVCYDHQMIISFPGLTSLPMCSQTTMRVSSGS
jgi:Flp pilus assembly protein TadG